MGKKKIVLIRKNEITNKVRPNEKNNNNPISNPTKTNEEAAAK